MDGSKASLSKPRSFAEFLTSPNIAKWRPRHFAGAGPCPAAHRGGDLVKRRSVRRSPQVRGKEVSDDRLARLVSVLRMLRRLDPHSTSLRRSRLGWWFGASLPARRSDLSLRDAYIVRPCRGPNRLGRSIVVWASVRGRLAWYAWRCSNE